MDKDDLRRYSDFVNRKVYDLLLIGQVVAKANGHDIIEPWNLPVTKGLQESVREFERMDEEVELRPILEQLWPPCPTRFGLQRGDGGEAARARQRFKPWLARAFKVLDSKLKNPQTGHTERAFRIFDLLLQRSGVISVARRSRSSVGVTRKRCSLIPTLRRGCVARACHKLTTAATRFSITFRSPELLSTNNASRPRPAAPESATLSFLHFGIHTQALGNFENAREEGDGEPEEGRSERIVIVLALWVAPLPPSR